MTRRTPIGPGWWLLIAPLGGAFLFALTYFVFVQFDIPPFHDERKGYPGIPNDIGYAIGTKKGVQRFGTILFGIYGGVLGLLFSLCIPGRGFNRDASEES